MERVLKLKDALQKEIMKLEQEVREIEPEKRRWSRKMTKLMHPSMLSLDMTDIE